MRVSCLLAAALLTLPAAARADVLDTVNWARLRACHPPAAAALQNNLKLQRAAGRLAGGAALSDAVVKEDYAGSEFSELHFSGAVNDAQMARMLTPTYCRTLSDPKFRELGAVRRGSELWIVLAAPAAIPAAADLGAVGRRMLDLVNEARAAPRRCGGKYFGAAAPLTLDEHLIGAALAHSREMAQHGEFDHRGHDGSSPAQRIQRAGYGAYAIVGENIAAGAMSTTEVMQGWLASPPHCENIMDGRFRQIGIAYAASPHSAAALYWTQDFAAPR